VDALINEHLLAEQALDAGLDSDPGVAHALQNARRRILAEAFASRLAGAQKQPTAAEIESYYQQNPALFSQRRLYGLAIFTVAAPALDDQLLAAIGHNSSVDALGPLLTQHAIRFEVQHLERAADELPLGQVAQYSAMSVGDVLVEAGDNGTTRLVQITAIQMRPISLENARPAIQRYLAQRSKAAALDAYLGGVRARARITYSTEASTPTRMQHAPAAPARQPTIATGHRTREAQLTALK
jgi:EpsD family peptidyl-prolyl cis-trans isomerase